MKKIGIAILILILGVTVWRNIELTKTINENSTKNSLSIKEDPKIESQEQHNTKEVVEATTPIENIKPTTSTADDKIISYVNTLDNEVNTLTSTRRLTTSVKTTLKETFITLTDFIFYNGTIKGVTFNELSTSIKEKVLEIYTKIDEKIESVWPNYKETIKTTTKNIYTNIKEKAISLKETLQQKYKDSVGEEAYNNSVKTWEEDIERIKESTAPTTSYIKEKSKETYETVKEKANNWYQNFKERDE